MAIEEGARSLQIGGMSDPLAAAMMCNGGGGFGGNNNMLGLLLVIALLGRRNLLGGEDGVGFARPEVLCCLQNAINELGSKLMQSQIALSDNVAQSTNSLTQNSNANFANTNGQIRDIASGMASGFAAAAMERCAMTSKLATDINQVGAAVLSATNQLDKTIMCGFNGLNTNLFNTTQSIKDQANAQFNVLSTKSDGIACGIKELSIQTACQTKDIINNDNNNTTKILCAMDSGFNKTLCAIDSSLNKTLCAITDLRKDMIIAEQAEALRESRERCHRQENEININRQVQLISDSIVTSVMSKFGPQAAARV